MAFSPTSILRLLLSERSVVKTAPWSVLTVTLAFGLIVIHCASTPDLLPPVSVYIVLLASVE